MESTEKVLSTIKAAGKPVSAGQIAELSGLDRKEVDKAMKKLKTDGSISSPKNCYWEPASK
jgi:biotin operon repressor